MGEGKTSISARIDTELIDWIDTQVNERRFRTRTHALEYALYTLKKSENVKRTI